MSNDTEIARKWLGAIRDQEKLAGVYALLAIAVELEKIGNMLGETIQRDGCIKVDIRQ